MSDKLKQAVDRLRRFAKGESMEGVYNVKLWGYDKVRYELRNDKSILADAYLAEHPADDDEPVTGEWLDSLFGVEEYICTEQDGNFDEVITWIETIGNVLIPMPKTRGDFRRVCKVMKIALKEPS